MPNTRRWFVIALVLAGCSDDASPANAAPDAADSCGVAGAVWKTARKTNYTSYPKPGSEECVDFSGCKYQGMFAACDDTKSEAWVKQHAIVAIFPGLSRYQLHDLCLSTLDGSHQLLVTVYDTCADSDCDGCCTQNKADAEALIDVEHYTDERWGVPDGPIQWLDMGQTKGSGCQG
jgi:hypothetical protein